nr:hypothetical protein [Syntrophotalea acetylenica]
MSKTHSSYWRGRVKVFQCRACRTQDAQNLSDSHL